MTTIGIDQPGPRPTGDPDDLGVLLGRAATGDRDAFLHFYDLTSRVVYRYARIVSADGPTAASLARDLYLRAWAAAAGQPASGMSPLAWLLARSGEGTAP